MNVQRNENIAWVVFGVMFVCTLIYSCKRSSRVAPLPCASWHAIKAESNDEAVRVNTWLQSNSWKVAAFPSPGWSSGSSVFNSGVQSHVLWVCRYCGRINAVESHFTSTVNGSWRTSLLLDVTGKRGIQRKWLFWKVGLTGHILSR